MQELPPFFDISLLVCGSLHFFLDTIGLRLWLRCTVDELEDEWPSCDDTSTSRKTAEQSGAGEVGRHNDTYKSLPTMFSSTELLPLDCDPTTAIWGKSMGFWTYRAYSQIVPGRVSGRNVMGPYADCCEDILKLVDESDESWIVDIDTAVQRVSCCFYVRWFQGLVRIWRRRHGWLSLRCCIWR